MKSNKLRINSLYTAWHSYMHPSQPKLQYHIQIPWYLMPLIQ